MNTNRLVLLLKKALESGALAGDDSPAVVIYDESELQKSIAELVEAFPSGVQHRYALKACPLEGVVQVIKQGGIGAECASLVEVMLALKIGFSPSDIIFDSPIKTHSDLSFALENKIPFNLNSLEELERVASLSQDRLANSDIGLRVNPEIGLGNIQLTSTASTTSKFGVSMMNNYDAIVDAFSQKSWLRRLHVHVGSQGMSIDNLVKGVSRAFALARHINEINTAPTIQSFDIGGGLPVSYKPDDNAPTFRQYSDILQKYCPDLFHDNMSVITEFGRSLVAHSAIVVSKVEYTMTTTCGRHIVFCHIGADMFLRACYLPNQWYHAITVHEPDGTLKTGPTIGVDVVGPLCFSGDRIAENRLLPKIESGDYIVIHDVGAYTMSMWSYYNSRCAPPVYLCDNNENFVCIREAQTPEAVMAFWTKPNSGSY